jgi:hypothetical protein
VSEGFEKINKNALNNEFVNNNLLLIYILDIFFKALFLFA